MKRNGRLPRLGRLTCGTFVLSLAVTPVWGDDSGYHPQYDYIDQGDDWYAGFRAPDPRYDFFGFLSAPFQNGDDFALGFYAQLDPFRFGPPLEATQSSRFEYFFCHGALDVVPDPPGGGGGGCVVHSDCWDNVYCDGLEACFGGNCYEGSVINCGDGDSCTLDMCDEGSDSCVSTPINSPPEMQALGVWQSSQGGQTVNLGWLPHYLADSYNVYRANAADLGDLACLQSGLMATTTTDSDTLAPGAVFLYLVTGYGCGSESTLGWQTGGPERANPSPCPVTGAAGFSIASGDGYDARP